MNVFYTRAAAAGALGFACLILTSCGQPYDKHAQDEAAWIRDNVGEKALPQDDDGTLFPTHPYDAFKGMDSHVETVYGHKLSQDEIKGRNTWVMWSGGNQEFWDYLARNSNGILDLLKICDSRYVRRKDRFPIMGLVPHPGMDETDPDADLGEPGESNFYGLHLDRYGDYTGEAGAYVEGPPPNPKIYGYASGIAGLRLFPCAEDPDPRVRKAWEQNRHKWDPDRYIRDEDYYKNPELIRPYRVGMSCGFCHISANPMNPPEDMAYAKWSNLSSNIGSQYFWFGRIFGPDFKRDNLLYYLTNYPAPGSLDTSLVATDGNNNPNTMNSVYQLLPRIIASIKSPKEKTPADTLEYMPRLDQGYLVDSKKIVDTVPNGPNDVKPLRFSKQEQEFLGYLGLVDPETKESLDRLPPLGDATSRHTPKVLADGADGIGGRGALCRVYLNIGEFGQEWRQPKLQNVMVGVTPQSPFLMSRCAEGSINWNVTMRRSSNAAKYFLVNSVPMRLEDAPNVENIKHPKADDDTFKDEAGNPPESYVLPNSHPKVLQGAAVFARDCFVCHSSLEQPDGFWADAANWKKWVTQPGYVKAAEDMLVSLLKEEVTELPAGDDKRDKYHKNDPFFEGFVKENYLSTDARYLVGDIGTNTARSLADNGGRLLPGLPDSQQPPKRMWNDYSSDYFKAQKRLPTPIEIAHPYDPAKKINWTLITEAGPGRYRPHSLSSMWAHAPYLHNNSVGYYPYEYGPDPRPSQEGQVLATFADGIQTVEGRVEIFEDSTRRLLGLPPTAGYEADGYRGFSNKPRREFDSIVRFEKDTALELPRVVVPDLIYMQTMAFLGVGIPRWLLILIVIALILFGIYLFAKGKRRLREGRGSWLRNIATGLLGLLIIAGIFLLSIKDHYRIGHIPKGTPVNLVVNLNGPGWITESPERKKLLLHALVGLVKAKKYQVTTLEDERLTVDGRPLVDILIEISKCPDLVLDKGHEFGIYQTPGLAAGNKVPVSVEEREALIEFLKKL